MKNVQYIPLSKAIADAIAVDDEGRSTFKHFLRERVLHDLVIGELTLNSVSSWKRALNRFFFHHAHQWTLIHPEYNNLCDDYEVRIASTVDAAIYTGNIPTSYADKLCFKTAIYRNFKQTLNTDANVWQDCFKVIDFWRCCSYDKFMDTHVARTVYELLDLPAWVNGMDDCHTFKIIFNANCRSVSPDATVIGYRFKVTAASVIGVLKDQYGVDASYMDAEEVDLTYVDLKHNNIIVKAETEGFDNGRVCGVKIVNKVLAYDDSYKPVLFIGDKWRGPEDLEHLKKFQPYMHNNFDEPRPADEPVMGGMAYSDDASAEVVGMIAKNFKHLNAGLSGRFKSDEPNESAKPSTHVYEIGNDPKECTLDYIQVRGRAKRKLEVKTDPDGLISGFGAQIKPIVVLAPEVYEAIKNEIRKQLLQLDDARAGNSAERDAVHTGTADIHAGHAIHKVDTASADSSTVSDLDKQHSVSYQAVESFTTTASPVDAHDSDSNSTTDNDGADRCAIELPPSLRARLRDAEYLTVYAAFRNAARNSINEAAQEYISQFKWVVIVGGVIAAALIAWKYYS